jgi:NAD(P)-dependent dehydrogenase (short-subunit alcohol dehydrogenase family)
VISVGERLGGKVAIVTGGASGIGAAIAARFRDEGATVAVLDLADGPAVDVRCDVTDGAAVDAAFDGVVGEHGRLDVLVNSAGVAHVGSVLTTTEADLDRVYAVNVKGVANSLRAGVRHMVAGGGGAILNLASIASVVGIPDRFAYSMSKGAVLTMTYSVATDHIGDGIRCNAISPARVHTPFVDRFLAESYPGREAEMFATLAATQPIGRMATPEEIAGLVTYLCSDEAAFVTGSNHLIDGGFTGVHT